MQPGRDTSGAGVREYRVPSVVARTALPGSLPAWRWSWPTCKRRQSARRRNSGIVPFALALPANEAGRGRRPSRRTPAAAAASRVGTTPRRRTNNTIDAPARTAYCQGSVERAGQAGRPSRRSRRSRRARRRRGRRAPVALARSRSKWRAPSRMNSERRRERDGGGEQPTAEPGGGVADDRDGLHDRARGDLAEGDGVEKLPVGHPVVAVDGVGLHQRDDHEPTAVGQRADLERDPGHRCSTPTLTRIPAASTGTGSDRGGAGARGEPRAVSSTAPQATRTSTSHGPRSRPR